MDSGDEYHEFPSQSTTDYSLDFETDPVQLDLGAVYFESTYQQLIRDRDDLRQRYEREKRERESLEIKYHQEYDQKVYFEEKLSDLSRNLSSYEEELQSLKLENSHIKAQFGQLKSAMQSRMSSGAVELTQTGITSASLSGNDVCFIANATNDSSSVPGSTEMCKQELALLAQENELFKHIIDSMEKQEHSKVAIEDVSGQSNERLRGFENEDLIRLEREKAQLEERVRVLERSNREQELMLEDVHNKAEDNLRVYKRESKVLENELYSQSTVVEDYEVQMSQMKQSYDEEIQQLELKLELEVTNNKQLQEQTHQLEKSICKLEEERKELLLKIEEAYKAENEVVDERTQLEESYSRDIIELRQNVEEEIQKKAEMSIEIERLMSELIECEKQKKQMEARFFHEAQELKLQLDKEREEIYSYLNGAAVSQVMMQSNVAQQTQPGIQLVAAGTQMLTKEEDWKIKLSEEVRKKERLEEENKKLLYQINDLLEQNVGGGVTNTTHIKHSFDYDVNKTSHSVNIEKLKDLEVEIDELKEHCRVLERGSKRKKELENINKQLSEEIEELTIKKDEIIRKQKEVMKELDDSLSSVQKVEDKNRRLAEEVENLSRKIRQMEDNYRNEKEDWMRNYAKEKTLQINELLSEKEIIERKYNEQVKINRSMEAEINSFQTRIYDLERAKERTERNNSEITSHLKEEINFERGRTKIIKDELDKSVEVFKKQTEQLETSLCEKKKKYDEEIRILEEEKQRIRTDLENEKKTYRRRFEEERKTMEERINEIEAKLRQKTVVNSDRVQGGQVTCTLTYDENSANGTINQSALRSSSQQTISALKRQIETLRTEYKELQETLRDTERKYRREIDDLEYDNEQKSRKVKIEIKEEFRQKIDDYERQIEDLKRKHVVSQETFPNLGCALGTNDYQDMSYLAIEHKEQMDELKRQIKLQMEAFENEKQNLKKELQDERQNTVRDKKSEVTMLNNTIHKLTQEMKKLKQEKETLTNKLRKERGNGNKQITEMSETVTKVTDECEQRIRKERERSQKSVNDLTRKLAVTESRMRTTEEKHRREIHELQVKFEYKKTELEQDSTSIESRLRESLQTEYRAALSKEKEKYEETLRVLRKEIASLQEQRKQIQTKLTSQSTQSSYSLLMDKSMSSKESFHKSEADMELRISRVTKQMKNRILDLEGEVEVLKKEKADIKASNRQEKLQIQTDFDRKRDRLEEKYEKQVEELKRRLQTATAQIQSSSLVTKKWDRSSRALKNFSDATERLNDKNLAIETKSNVLETQLGILNDRMDDIEERQKRSMNSNTTKSTGVRFSSSLERGRDQSRLANRLSSSMLDLSSSAQLLGGTYEKSRIALSSHSTGRLNREAKETRSFLSQSPSDLRSLAQGAGLRDDRFLSSRSYGLGSSLSITHGRPEIFASRSPSFFRGRTLSGFDTSRFQQTGSSFRHDQYFLPSVGILGGSFQARGGTFGDSLIGGSGMHSGFGFQRPMTGPILYGQSATSGFDGRLYHSSSFNGLHQQLPTQVQGGSSNATFPQASVGVTGSGDWNRVNVVSSTEVTGLQQAIGCQIGSREFIAATAEDPGSQQADGCQKGNMESTAAIFEGPFKEGLSSEREIKDATSPEVNSTSQKADEQAADKGDVFGCKVDRDARPDEAADDQETCLKPTQPSSEDAMQL